jgi:diguanylate cyclase (GGDEF)-like protein/PAS domain S-box-containing protein
MKTYRRPQNVALLALACGVAATLFAWFLAGRQVQGEAQAEFAGQANLAANILERRVQRYIDLLYGLEALAYHDESLSRAEFAHYAAALELGKRFPGVTAVEFIRRVPDAEREAFVAQVRNDRATSPNGYPKFDIVPPGRRSEYWVIEFIEPMDADSVAFGLDIRERPPALEATQRARDSAEPVATGRYRLAQETGSSYGLVLYLPVYGTERPQSVAQRRASVRGFVNVVLRIDDLLGAMLAEPGVHGLGMRIHDVGRADAQPATASGETLFYTSALAMRGEPGWDERRQAHARALVVAGRQWRIEFEGAPGANPWLTRFPLLMLGAGTAMTLLLFGFFYAIARTRSEAVGLAKQATRDLRTQLSFTQQLIEALPNPVFSKDAQGRYLGCNRAFEEYVGRTREALVGKSVHEVMPAELADRTAREDAELINAPGSQTFETTARYAKDGVDHEVLVNKATFFGPSGEVAGLVGVLVDITDRKKLEAAMRESNERLVALIHAAPIAIIARDLAGVIVTWNPAAEEMFGWSEAEVLNTPTTIVPPHLREETLRMRDRTQAGETFWIEETQRMRRDGSLVDVSMSIAPIYGAEGKASGTMVTITDISRRKQAETALRESESQLRLAMEAAQLGMWYWEAETDRFSYSDGLNKLFGRPGGSPYVGYRELQERLHPEDRELFEATMRHALKAGDDFQVDYRVVWPDGSVHWVANRGQVHRGADGRAIRVIGMAMNITERKIAEQRIAHMAHHDALTGLPNRVLLRDRIQQAIAQAHRSGTQLAVLFLDLDRFKTINDSLGHQLGDRLLQSVASRILVCVREGDTVSRMGGDEFVIVIPGIGAASDASAVAAKILEVLANAFHLHGNDLHVAASIGISLYPADGSDAETLMRNADTAMYHAKDSGRGNFQFFTQHMNVAAQQRLSLENSLRRALDQEEFELHYQPLYDLRDRSITGFEALLRWNTPDGEMVAPGSFITAAEESGLIVPIGEWVLREAMRQSLTWQAPGRRVSVSINVSAAQLSRTTFVEHLRRAIAELDIDPTLIQLEVTESVIIEGAGDARESLYEIAALGVGIAIDDFGTGYSGLAYLKRLPIDTVKIDQSFVRDLTIDPDDKAIVTAIVAMAKSLGVDVVAEGVETEEQLEELKRLGCTRAQGFLLARPMTAASVGRFLARLAAVA